MITGHLVAALLPSAERSARRWLFHVGGLALIPLGLLDNALIPIPGIGDLATVLLASRHEELWLYYALMSTAGSLIGGFLTYRIARQGGKEALDHRFSRCKVDKLCEICGRWGFLAVAIPALLPPLPIVPFLFAAGAMQYPVKKFLAALTLGRLSRFLLLSYLAAHYRRQIVAFVAEHEHPGVVAIVTALLIVAAIVFYFWRGSNGKKRTWKIAGRAF